MPYNFFLKYIKQFPIPRPAPSSKERGWGEAIFLLFLFFCSTNTFSQKQYNCFDWKTNVTVNTFLVQKMHDQYDERRKEFAKALTSKKLTQEYIQTVQKKFFHILGNFPVKTPLNATITGTLHRDGYRIEKIIYESFPNHHVTANLYIPDGKAKISCCIIILRA